MARLCHKTLFNGDKVRLAEATRLSGTLIEVCRELQAGRPFLYMRMHKEGANSELV